MPRASHLAIRKVAMDESAVRALAFGRELEKPGRQLLEAGDVHRLADVPPVTEPAVVVRVPTHDERTRVGTRDDRPVRRRGQLEDQNALPSDPSGGFPQIEGSLREVSGGPGAPVRLRLRLEAAGATSPDIVPKLVNGCPSASHGEEDPDRRL